MSQLVGKRMDALARNRARADLARKYEDEYRELVSRHLSMLRAEYAITGIEPPRNRNEPKHVDDGDGTCAHCGQRYPCEHARKREREKARRRAQPVPKTFDEVQTSV